MVSYGVNQQSVALSHKHHTFGPPRIFHHGYLDSLIKSIVRRRSKAELSPEGLRRMKAAYEKDVAVLPPTDVASIIESGGFEAPVQFFQAGLINVWFAKRAAEHTL